MKLSYFFYCRKSINGKVKCIYIKSDTLSRQNAKKQKKPRQYVKYKNEMITYNKYKKIVHKKSAKKQIKGGNDFKVFTDNIYPGDIITLQNSNKAKLVSNFPLFKDIQYSNFEIKSVDGKRIDHLDPNQIKGYKLNINNKMDYITKHRINNTASHSSPQSSKKIVLRLLPNEPLKVRSSTSNTTRGLMYTDRLQHKKHNEEKPFHVITGNTITSIRHISPLSSSVSGKDKKTYRKTPGKPIPYPSSTWLPNHSPRRRLNFIPE